MVGCCSLCKTTDYRKLQPRLLSNWPSIPIEVEPLAAHTVLRSLRALGSPNPALRAGHLEKAGPLKTDQDNFIVDAPFPAPLLIEKDISIEKGPDGKGAKGMWSVGALAAEIKGTEGVLSVGIFCGINGEQALKIGSGRGGQKPVAVYFGMEDGSVAKRVAMADGTVAAS